MHKTNWFLKVVITFLSLLLLSVGANGAQYQLDKVRLNLSTKNPITTLKISNPNSDATSNLQIALFKWTQEKGENVLQPSKDLIVAPPLMGIAPKKSQIVRIGWRTPIPNIEELTYRILITDITPLKKVPGIIQFKIQSSIPIFITPTAPVRTYNWQIKPLGNNQVKVILSNTGNVHLQISNLSLSNSNNKIIALDKEQFYVLAHQTKERVISTQGALGNHVLITATTDNGEISADAPVS